MDGSLRKLLLVFVAVVLPLFILKPAYGADFDYKVTSTYDLRENGTVRARTIIEVTNNVNTPAPSSLVVPVAGTATDISASYQDGGEINANFGAENDTIRLETTKDQSGRNKKWSVVINYDVDAATTFGDSTIVSITPLDYGDMNITQESVTITADLSLGVAVARGPEPNASKISAGKQVLSWRNANGPLKSAVGVLFGNDAVAEVRIQADISNDSWWWQTKTLTLPPDTNQQMVFLDSIEPAPTNVRLDVDGNILAEYRLRPQSSVSVTGLATVVVKNFTYALDSQTNISETPPGVSQRYTMVMEPWTGGVIEYESGVDQPAADTVEDIFDLVVAAEISGEDDYQMARERADLLIGELRSRSIPARLVLGHIFGDGGVVFNEGQPHAWIEAYVAGIGWMTLDPTLEQKGEYFGTTDVQHVGLVLRGVEADFPPDQLFDTTVTYTDNDIPETPVMEPKITATKYVILPGFSLDSVSVKMPTGVIVDNTAVALDGSEPRQLGSLSPLQNAQIRSFSYALDAFSSESVAYGPVGTDGISEVIAKTTMTVNYTPLIILVGLAVIVVIVAIIRRRRSPKRERAKRSKDAVMFAVDDNGEAIEEADLIPATPPKQTNQATEIPSSDTISTDETPPESKQRRRPMRQKIQ